MVTEGYKKTEVGIIPEDWNIVYVGSVLSFKNGLNKESEFFGYGTPIVNYMDVFNKQGLLTKDIKGKVFLSNQEKRNFSARKGDVFFTRTSETQEEIGMSAVLLENIEGCVFSGFVLRGRPLSKQIVTNYYQYCFNPKYIRNQIISTSSFTTRALTNGRYLSNVKLVIPANLKEQEAIAKVLTDTDNLIQALEKVIAKKKAIKKGAMQQLLTGKTRLQGYGKNKNYKQTELGVIPEDWSVVELEDLSIRIGDGIHSTPEYSETGEYMFINGNNLTNGKIKITNSTKKVDRKEYIKYKRGLSLNTLLLSINGTIGNIAYYLNEDIILGKSSAYINIHDNYDRVLVFYILQSSFVKEYFSNNLTGSTIKNLGLNTIRKTLIPLAPTKEEQKAIAKVLSDMDKEIEALEVKKEKYIQLKKGLAQELLTGKTRLV